MIACIGEILFDLIAEGSEVVAPLRPRIGGSPANVALAIAAQGYDNTFLGQLADDRWGRYMLNYLQERNVGTDYLRLKTGYATALALVQTDQQGSNHYAFYTDNTADMQLDRNFPRPELSKIEAVTFGSYSMAVPSFRHAVEPFLWESSQKAFISFDPNIRPSLLPSVKEYQLDFQRWCRFCDMIKLSDEDLAWLNEEQESLIKRCFAQRTKIIIITHGEEGATLYHRNGAQLHCAARARKVVDTVGAGDTFHGSMIAFLAEHKWLDKVENLSADELKVCLNWSVHAAALNCERPGCAPPSKKEIAHVCQIPSC